jgi:hypothetical protein
MGPCNQATCPSGASVEIQSAPTPCVACAERNWLTLTRSAVVVKEGSTDIIIVGRHLARLLLADDVNTLLSGNPPAAAVLVRAACAILLVYECKTTDVLSRGKRRAKHTWYPVAEYNSGTRQHALTLC